MLIEKAQLSKYRPEIAELYENFLKEIPTPGLIYFGSFSDSDGENELMAFGALKNYLGSWYLRGCVVKPEYRGNGLQRLLIGERMTYLKNRTHIARVSVLPTNLPSIHNVEAEGFKFEKKKKLESGHEVNVYKLEW